MEVVVVILSAWVAILYLEAVYWAVRLVLSSTPMIAAGVGAGWLAQASGLGDVEALGVGVMVCLAGRCLLRPRNEDEYL